MALFQFDPIGEYVVEGYRWAQMKLALLAGGAKALDAAVQPGIRVHKRDLPTMQTSEPQGSQRPHYCTPDEFIQATTDEIGISNTTTLIRRGAQSSELKREVQERRQKIDTQYAKCVAEIENIRRKFHPNYDIADIEDGPPEYAEEVKACIKKHFPPLMTKKRLLADLEKYSRKLAMLAKGRLVPAERDEMRARAAYFEYWCGRMKLAHTPDPINADHVTPHAVRCYLNSLANHLRDSIATQESQNHLALPEFKKNIKARRQAGRPRTSSPADDEKLFLDKQASGQKIKDFAQARGLKPKDVEKAINRHKSNQRRRTNSVK